VISCSKRPARRKASFDPPMILVTADSSQLGGPSSCRKHAAAAFPAMRRSCACLFFLAPKDVALRLHLLLTRVGRSFCVFVESSETRKIENPNPVTRKSIVREGSHEFDLLVNTAQPHKQAAVSYPPIWERAFVLSRVLGKFAFGPLLKCAPPVRDEATPG